MSVEDIIGLCIYVVVGLMIITIGFFQYKSENPVSFYTNETPLPSDKYLDVTKWNHYHGLTFMIYGFVVILGCSIGIIFIKNSILGVILCAAFVLVPLPITILIHEKLKKKYIKK